MGRHAASSRWTLEPVFMRPRSVCTVAFIHVLLLVAIGSLLAISRRDSGFVTLNDGVMESLVRSLGIGADLSVVWTTVPSIIVQAFVFFRNSTADDAAARQLLTQLKSASGATQRRPAQGLRQTCRDAIMGYPPSGLQDGRVALLQDYRHMNPADCWVSTIRNRHWHLSAALGLSFVSKALLVPLAAALITAQTVLYTAPSQVSYMARFNLSDAFAGRFGDEWNQVLNSAAAELLRGGRAEPWTSGIYALQPIQLLGHDAPTAAKVSATSIAYAETLDCNVLERNDYHVTYIGRPAEAEATLAIEDRGCSFNRSMTLNTRRRTIHFQASRFDPCPDPSNPSRVFFAAATSVNDTIPRIDQINIFSCVPVYTTTKGILTASWSRNGTALGPETINFTPNEPPVLAAPRFANVSDIALLTASTLVNSVANNAFGMLIVDIAASAFSSAWSADERYRAALLDADLLHRTIRSTVSTVYRTAVARIGFQPTLARAQPSEGNVVDAVLEAPSTRLLVRPWVAAVLLTTVVLSLVSTAWLALVAAYNPLPIAVPESVLAYAALLLHGGADEAIAALVADVAAVPEGDDRSEERWIERAKRRWTMESARVWIDNGTKTLRTEGLRRRDALGARLSEPLGYATPVDEKAGAVATVSEQQKGGR